MRPAVTQTRLPAVLLLAASLALSALAIVRDPLLGAAAIDNLVTAADIDRDWGAALQMPSSWELQSLLVALLHAMTSLSFEACARMLDAALFAVLALGFARLLARLGSEQRYFGWASLVLLLFPALNQLRGAALEDAGFWAFLFAAAAVLARYHPKPGWPDAFRWAALSVIAVLFSSSALPYALLMPLACLWREPYDERPGGVLRLYAALGTLCLLPLLITARLGDLPALMDRLLPALLDGPGALADNFMAASARLGGQVLDLPTGMLPATALAAALLVVLLVALLQTLGVAGAGLLGWAVATRRTLLPDGSTRAIALLLLAIGLLLACARVAATRSLDAIAIVPLALALLVPCTFAARELLGAADASRRPLLARSALVALLIALFSMGFLNPGARTGYPNDCIRWMQLNLPADARIFSNDRQLGWYSRRMVDWSSLPDAEAAIIAREAPLAEVDFWVIRVDAKDRDMLAALAAYSDVLEPVARFAGEPSQQVIILKPAR